MDRGLAPRRPDRHDRFAARSSSNRLLYWAGVSSCSPPLAREGLMPLGRSSVLLMLAVFLFSSSSLVAQQRTRTKPHRAAARFSHPELLYSPLHLHGISLSPTGNIAETEPNNTAATATAAAL